MPENISLYGNRYTSSLSACFLPFLCPPTLSAQKFFSLCIFVLFLATPLTYVPFISYFVLWFLVDSYQKTKMSAVLQCYLKKDQARFRINKLDSWYFGLLVAIYQTPKDKNLRWTEHIFRTFFHFHFFNHHSWPNFLFMPLMIRYF